MVKIRIVTEKIIKENTLDEYIDFLKKHEIFPEKVLDVLKSKNKAAWETETNSEHAITIIEVQND